MYANLKHNCKLTRRQVHEHLDGALSPEAARALDVSLSACPDCAAYARRLAEATDLLHTVDPVITPDALRGRIMNAARAQLAYRSQPAGRLVPRLQWAAAAAVVCLATLAVFALHPRGTGVPQVATETGAPAVTGPATSLAEAAPRTPSAARPASVARANAPSVRTASALARRVAAAARARAIPAPRTFLARSRGNSDAMPSETLTASAPIQLAMAPPRVSAAPAASYASTDGSFADEFVGNLVADTMLSSYLDGAPPGLSVTPESPGGPQ